MCQHTYVVENALWYKKLQGFSPTYRHLLNWSYKKYDSSQKKSEKADKITYIY